MPVRVQVRAPLTEVDNTVEISVGDGAPNALVDPRLLTSATVHVASRNAVSVTLSNAGDFRRAETFELASPPPGIRCETTPDETGAPWTRCSRPGWDLTARDAQPDNGLYSVHALFRDAEGYASPPVLAQVAADVDPPVLLNAAVIPPVTSPGTPTVISITANEQLQQPTLTVSPPLSWALSGAETTDGKTWVWRGIPTGGSASHQMEVTLADVNGQAPRTLVLRERPEDETSPALALKVDGVVPDIWSVLPFRVTADGVTREFDYTNELPVDGFSLLEFDIRCDDDQELARSAVTLNGFDVDCDVEEVDPTEWVLRCSRDTRSDFLFEGRAVITALCGDRAGNTNAYVIYELIVDHSDPSVVQPALLLDNADLVGVFAWEGLQIAASESADLLFTTSEPLQVFPVATSNLGFRSGPAFDMGEGQVYQIELLGQSLGPGTHVLSIELEDVVGRTSVEEVGVITVTP